MRLALHTTGACFSTCRGNSMLPILSNPSDCWFIKQEDYKVGDIVFCRVKGRYIDAHKIISKSEDGRFLIANNHGHQNGWTRTIYGRVYRAKMKNGNIKEFD